MASHTSSVADAVLGLSWAPEGMKKGRRPRRHPRLKLFDRTGPARGPVPVENVLFPVEIAGFLARSRRVPVYPVFLKYPVPVQLGKFKASHICQDTQISIPIMGTLEKKNGNGYNDCVVQSVD